MSKHKTTTNRPTRPAPVAEPDESRALVPTQPAAVAPQAPGNGLTVPEEAYALLERVPDVDDDPTPRMAEQILLAEHPDDWARIFQARSIKNRVGGKYRIVAIRKAPSTFEGSLPFFLIAEAVALRTGESEVISISSVMAVLQLIVAHDRDWFPIDVEIVQKDRPTKAGFYPIHLRALSSDAAAG